MMDVFFPALLLLYVFIRSSIPYESIVNSIDSIFLTYFITSVFLIFSSRMITYFIARKVFKLSLLNRYNNINRNVCFESGWAVKNFIKGTGYSISHLDKEHSLHASSQYAAIEFLIDAPKDYAPSQACTEPPFITLHFDRASCQRELAENCYQVRCVEPFDTFDFMHWAENAVSILTQALTVSGVSATDIADFKTILQSEPSQRFLFTTFDSSDTTYQLDHLTSQRPRAAFGVFTDGADLSLQEYSAVDTLIFEQLHQEARLHMATCVLPEQEQARVVVLYGAGQ